MPSHPSRNASLLAANSSSSINGVNTGTDSILVEGLALGTPKVSERLGMNRRRDLVKDLSFVFERLKSGPGEEAALILLALRLDQEGPLDWEFRENHPDDVTRSSAMARG